MRGEAFGWGMLRKRELTVPSWKGAVILLAAALGAGRFSLTHVQPFLAVQAPVRAEVLVVEGWIPDYALKQALERFRSGHYRLLLTTGGALPQGMVFSAYGNYAHFAARTLEQWGLPPDSLREIPSPSVQRDRTYQEGLSLGQWLRDDGNRYAAVDLFSFSTHARRSRLLYRMALGEGIRVGVYAPLDAEYDPAAWWKNSNGVRRVTDEAIAYLYAKLIFRPGAV